MATMRAQSTSTPKAAPREDRKDSVEIQGSELAPLWPNWTINRVLADRPRIRVNQVGYLVTMPIKATLLSPSDEPLQSELVDDTGSSVSSARSEVFSPVAESYTGLFVHLLEHAPILSSGQGFCLRVAEECSRSFNISADLYGNLRQDALKVLTLLRSGFPIDNSIAPAEQHRPAGHMGVPPNQGDLAVRAWQGPDAEKLYPGWRCPGTFDVSGGWYDAGDYGKYVTSGSIAVWQLLRVMECHLASAEDHWTLTLREECRFQLDWLIRMQVPLGFPLAGMVFHKVHGTTWSPLPGWAHDDPSIRVLHRPSTAATFQFAAVTAHAARLFRRSDPAYADRLLSVAQTAFRAASENERLDAPDDHAMYGGGPYPDENPDDDHYWAVCELWLTTQDPVLESTLLDLPSHHQVLDLEQGFDFDYVIVPARLDLGAFGSGLSDFPRVKDSIIDAANALVDCQNQQPWGQTYSPTSGWCWGSNGLLLNQLILLAVANDLVPSSTYTAALVDGVSYLFGRNPLGQSFVTGYGTDYSRYQRTRQFAQAVDTAFPPVPKGALAGGANSVSSEPEFPYDDRLRGLPEPMCYLDEPTSEVTNDICIRWNAGLVGVADALMRTQDKAVRA